MSKSAKGVTLIELIGVVAIVGILAAVALPKKESDANLAIPFQARKLATDIRRIQLNAMATSTAYCLVSSATGYMVTNFTSSACGTSAIKEPDSTSDWLITLPTGMSLTVASLAFDTMGEPRTASGLGAGNSQGTNTVWTMQTTGTSPKSHTITVYPLTGFVKVNP